MNDSDWYCINLHLGLKLLADLEQNLLTGLREDVPFIYEKNSYK